MLDVAGILVFPPVLVLLLAVVPIAYIATLGRGERGRNARKVLAMLLRWRPPTDPPHR